MNERSYESFPERPDLSNLPYVSEFFGKSTDGILQPLYIHLENTYQAAYRIAVAFGIPENLMAQLLLAALLHDIGKATQNFQEHRMQKRNPSIKVPHALYSQWIVEDVLGYGSIVGEYCGIHHGWIDTKEVHKEEAARFLAARSAREKEYHLALIQKAVDITGWNENMPTATWMERILLSGFLILSDWLASDPRLFQDVCGFSKHRMPEVSGLQWLHCFRGFGQRDYAEIFGFPLNDLQITCHSLASVPVNDGGGLYLVESPTGSGKTEAALIIADQTAKSFHSNGVIYALPTQAATKIQHNRLEPIFRQADRSYTCGYCTGNGSSHDSYFSRSRKMEFFNTLQTCTIDQLLDRLKIVRHFPMLWSALWKKTIILDEVHTYDSVQRSYIQLLLTIARHMQTTVILLSASLPAKAREKLILSYTGKSSRKNVSAVKKSLRNDFPCITRIALENAEMVSAYGNEAQKPGKGKVQVKAETRNCNAGTARRLPIALHSCIFETEEVFAAVRNVIRTLEPDACIGILLSNVQLVQDLYDRLHKDMSERRFCISHGAFLPKDRCAHDAEILKCCGKESTAADRCKSVVIGTQTLEQSLDLDFDYLITDLAPADVLIQRIGRVRRHCRSRAGHQSPYVFILADSRLDQEEPPAFISVYASCLLQRTLQALRKTQQDGICQLEIPEDTRSFLDFVYEGLSDLQIEGDSSGKLVKPNFSIPAENGRQISISDELKNQGIHNQYQRLGDAVRFTPNPSEPCVLLRQTQQGLQTMDGITVDAKEMDNGWSVREPESLRRCMEETVSVSRKKLYQLCRSDLVHTLDLGNHTRTSLLVFDESGNAMTIHAKPSEDTAQYTAERGLVIE